MSDMVPTMIEQNTILPFLLYCALVTGTPGPNNTMALTSGVRVGFVRSIPLLLGISIGVGIQLIAVGLGLNTLFQAFPTVYTIMRIAGALFLLWFAYCIATSGPIDVKDEDADTVGFFGAATFQWINPKAWFVTATAVALYVPADNYVTNILLAGGVLTLIALPCVGIWVVCGVFIRRLLSDPLYARAFNLLAASTMLVMTGFFFAGDVNTDVAVR